jgi:hypothetical protein
MRFDLTARSSSRGDGEAVLTPAGAVRASVSEREAVLTPPRAARRGARDMPASPLLAWIEARALFIVAVSTVIVLSLAGIPHHLGQDGWLALIAGRDIVAHGIPHHDYFTHMSYGVRWVDQQWLAQLVMYELERIGGLQLLTVAYVVITGAAFGGAVAAARKLGGEDLHVLMILPIGAFFYLATAVSIRTQGFAYPLFVATVWLLASEARSTVRSRRVYWVFPLLLVWANLHGSVTLGVGVACVYGLTLLVTGLRAGGLRGVRDARAWVFLLLPPLTLLATPYGTEIVHYYHVTLMNPEFSKLITEWEPVTSTPVLAIPLFLTFAVTGVVILRACLRARSSRTQAVQVFEIGVLLVLAAGATTAVRNITWFGLALVVLLPAAITQMKRGRAAPLRRARANRIWAIAMVAITALGAVAILARPASWFTSTYPTKAVPTLRTLVARDPSASIFADVRYSDWLIWEDPQLFSGRVAYDTSLELLTPAQLRAIADPAAKSQAGRTGLLAPYPIWVLYPSNRSENRTLLKRRGVHVVLRSSKVLIVTHRTSASG